jgi:uncharacterized protein YbjT (DUF2867 family)
MERVLVTGATGRVGGQVVRQLLAAGRPVRALARDPMARLPDGVDVAVGDLSDPASLTAALSGVDQVFLVFPTVAADHAAADVVAAIARHGRRIVYLSAAGVDRAGPGGGIQASHARMEALVRRSGLAWTFLRPSGFAANTLAWAPQVRRTGVVRWFHGQARRAAIHERDIAAVAVRALTEPGHDGARHHLTGPAQLRQVDQATQIGDAIGRPIRFDELPPDVARTELFAGMPDAVVDGILAAHADMVTTPEPVTSTVEALTGRPASTFAQWAADHAGDFR